MGIAGTVLAPTTFGGSLVLATTGVAMSVGGTFVSSRAASKIERKINETINTCKSKSLFDAFNSQIIEWNEVAGKFA